MSMEIESKTPQRRAAYDDHTGASAKKMRKENVYHNFQAPEDWPKEGEIDLDLHDLPHKSANTEWWYVNGHVHVDAPKRRASRGKKAEENGNDMDEEKKPRELSFFASFFRIVKQGHFDENGKALEHEYLHSLTWAISDSEKKEYHAFPVQDPATPDVVLDALNKGDYEVDPRLRMALQEIVAAKQVPLPDKIIPNKISVGTEKFGLDYGGNTFKKDKHGNYLLHCEDKEAKMSLSLTLKPIKSAVRQGHDGIVQVGVKEETMFYYFIPRTECHGTMQIKDEKLSVTGSAWYDHEFGGEVANKKADASASTGIQGGAKANKKTYAWNWFSTQLENGTDLTATMLLDLKTNEIVDKYVVMIDGDDVRQEFQDIDLQPEGTDSYVSVRTTIDYPMRWRLTVPEKQIDLVATADFPEQEFISLIAKPAFWEGRMNVQGTIEGKAVKGLGFLERANFGNMGSLDTFFKKISKQVLKAIDRVLPLKPTFEQTRDLVTTTEFPHFMNGLNSEVYLKTIIEPLRTIIDRGGKSWRSFACLLCIDAVGGESEKYRHWLAMPEILHVGSLIVDDIQDKSEVRRGGKSAHLLYGDAIAINAGTAAYFIALHTLLELTPWLTTELKNRVYEIYFLTLRAGHAGQAFDIYGLDYMMDEACKSQSVGTQLVERVTCTHRLKSAVPAGCLARMGATLGGGNADQIETVGMYFESIGIAFQVIDDVLNLRGFQGNTKDRGEDIVAGKVTYPVAKAMAMITNEAERTKLWSIVKSKPQDRTVVEEAIQMMEKAGAIDASVKDAENMVHDAWSKCDKHIPPSFFKMLLRAFGIYVLERHY